MPPLLFLRASARRWSSRSRRARAPRRCRSRCAAVEENLGVPRHIASFVLPLGRDGEQRRHGALRGDRRGVRRERSTASSSGSAGRSSSSIVSIATAIGAPGIPSAGMVTMVVVLEAVGLPGEAVGHPAHDRPLPRHVPHGRERRGRCGGRGRSSRVSSADASAHIAASRRPGPAVPRAAPRGASPSPS